MIFTDEIFIEMSRIVSDSGITKDASKNELKVDLTQFDMLDTTSEEFSLHNLPLSQGVILKEAEDVSKEVLKGKKRALEVDDIVDQAHPETIHMAEGPMGSGVVENQNEQHQKLLNIVNRMPSGFHYNKMSNFVSDLVVVANDLVNKGDHKAAKRVDMIAMKLASNGSFLDGVGIRLKESTFNTPALSSTMIVESIDDVSNKTRFMETPDKVDYSKKSITPLAKPILSPAPVTLPPAPVDLGKAPIQTVKRPVPAPVTLPPAPVDLGKAPIQTVKRPVPAPVTLPPAKVHGPVKPGLLTKLMRTLSKGKNGRIGLALAAAGLAATLLTGFGSLSSSSQSDIKAIKDKAKGPKLANDIDQVERHLNDVESSVKGMNKKDPTAMAEVVGKFNKVEAEIATLSIDGEDPEVQQAIGNLRKRVKGVAGKIHDFTNQAAHSIGVSPKQERERITGIQNFFKDDQNASFKVNGLMDGATRASIKDFVNEMKQDLNISPKFFSARHIIQYGTGELMSELFDLWRNPAQVEENYGQ